MVFLSLFRTRRGLPKTLIFLSLVQAMSFNYIHFIYGNKCVNEETHFSLNLLSKLHLLPTCFNSLFSLYFSCKNIGLALRSFNQLCSRIQKSGSRIYSKWLYILHLNAIMEAYYLLRQAGLLQLLYTCFILFIICIDSTRKSELVS